MVGRAPTRPPVTVGTGYCVPMANSGPIIWHWQTSAKSRAVATAARAFVKPVMTFWPMTDRGIDAASRLNARLAARLPRPVGAGIVDDVLAGRPCEVTRPVAPAQTSLAGVAILYLHGGAFLFGGPATHRPLTTRLSADAGVEVYSLDYRQLPEAPVAASVDDAIEAYLELRERLGDDARVVVAGDSAGGYLAMKVAELAAARGEPAPLAVVAYSPLLDLDFATAHPRDFLRRDAYLPLRPLPALGERWSAGEIEGARSPIDAPVEGFPPVMMVAAENEMLRLDIETMTHRLDDAGIDVQTHIWAGQVHAFPVIGDVLPESRQAIADTVAFLRRAAEWSESGAPDTGRAAGS